MSFPQDHFFNRACVHPFGGLFAADLLSPRQGDLQKSPFY